MIYSMTGFGKTSAEVAKETSFTVEISSVNRKQLELRFNLPREITMLETDLRKLFSSEIGRGMVNIRITLGESAKNELDSIEINQNLLNKLLESAVKLRAELNISNATLDLASFYNINGVVTNSCVDLENSHFKNDIIKACQSALKNFLSMRQAEGEELAIDLKKRIVILKELLEKIIPFSFAIKDSLKNKIMTKLKDEDFKVDLNDERLQKEILFYVDKSDVSEEITRLHSHFVQFDKLFENTTSEPGRNMDFLLQEMFREINTLGNKSGSTEVSPLVVAFKSELEKIREQVQNIE